MARDVTTFAKDWWADAWSHAREAFRWLHPLGAAGCGFLFVGFRQGWSVAAGSAKTSFETAGFFVVVWAFLFLTSRMVASLPRIYGQRLEEIRQLRAALEQATVAGAVWPQLEQRFAELEGEVDAGWSYNTVTGELAWTLSQRLEGGAIAAMREGRHLSRIKERFDALASEAGRNLSRLASRPTKFGGLAGDISARDLWLNAVLALVDHSREIGGTSRSRDQRGVSGWLSSAVDASRLACARLAAGDVPDGREVNRRRASELSGMISNYDELLNAAIKVRFDDDSRARIDQHAQQIGDALAVWGGPAQRALFFSAMPHPQVFSGLPAAHAGYWQKHVGQMQHLRTVAADWSR